MIAKAKPTEDDQYYMYDMSKNVVAFHTDLK